MPKIIKYLAYRTQFEELKEHLTVVISLILITLLTIAPVGYHVVVLNVPEKVIQNALNMSMYKSFKWSMNEAEISVFWSVAVSCQSVGALLACLFIVPLMNRHGTKNCLMIINNTILLAGSVVMACSAYFEIALFLLLGRILIGIYTGLASALLPIFIRELAPTSIKGALSCGMHIAVCIGAMLAAILSLDFVLGTSSLWGVLLSLPGVFAGIQMIIATFLPDTPNHLLGEGNRKQAVSSIKFYYGMNDAWDESLISKYRELVLKVPEQISYQDAFRDPSLRWSIFVGMIVSGSQVFCGSMATISYSTSMFNSVSFVSPLVPFLPTIGAALSVILTLPAICLVEKYGRRVLFISSLIILVLCDYFLAIFTVLSQNVEFVGLSLWSVLFGVAFFFYGLAYNLGVGPTAFFIPGELVPSQVVSVALGAAVATNWFGSLVTTFLFYPLNLAIGGWSYLLFAIPSTIFLIFLWNFLPETKHKDKGAIEWESLVDFGKPDQYGTFMIRQF